MKIGNNNMQIWQIKELDNNKALVINQEYQRRSVWMDKDKTRLIESILLELPIPEVYIWQRETEAKTGVTTFEVVDGQQRLKTVIEFIENNHFKLKKRHLEFKDTSYSGKSFQDLTDTDKQKLWRYEFVTRIIPPYETQENVEKMFLRLNSANYSLNPQELRNAEFDGEFIDLSLKMAEHDFWSKYEVFSKNEIRRMVDVQFCSSILIFLRIGIEAEKQSILNKMYDRFNEAYEEKEEDKETFLMMIDVVSKFLDVDNTFANKRTQLYTLFNIAKYLISSGTEIDKNILNKFERFCTVYNSDIEEVDREKGDSGTTNLILDFKSACNDGTTNKQQREKRYTIMLKYFLSS